ncbi:secreted RxLR effector protein 161-like [Salvia splendens]|uniref:secreted RxLR effector protein 161-like n=1 Tax=Salvia splendens TaxID=180675 RepID=UPI001C256D0F|nr:secreted RxLR effector protein 161-like [Salvia splendens]
MENAKAATTPLSQSFKLSKEQAHKTEQEALEMYMSDPKKEHWNALRWILRYMSSTSSWGVLFKGCDKESEEVVVRYCDADYATNLDNRKSQAGYLFTMFGTVVSWKSGLQSVVALSTTEAEYMVLTSAVQESF